MEEDIYKIYTDASFDNETKLGAYAIIIMQKGIVIKTVARRCKITLQSSTECEIFAIYQAINVILSGYINKDKIQKFHMRTDCSSARDFFVEKNNEIKIFDGNLEMAVLMKKVYKRICQKLSRKDCSFKIKWVPREANKIAHKYAYTAFQKLKVVKEKNEILVIDKKSLFEIFAEFDKKQLEVIKYLLNISNEQKIILMTQKQIASSLKLSVSVINNTVRKLININVLEKVKNGQYVLLI